MLYKIVETEVAASRGAGIYVWRVGGAPIYVGQSKRLDRRIRQYARNVAKLIDGRPYRKNNPGGFRKVHHDLLSAHRRQVVIEVSILENCDRADLNSRERFWHSQLLNSEI